MVYLGHFKFLEIDKERRFGHFSCVVEAKTSNAAERAFKKLIRDIRKSRTIFCITPTEVYLEAMIELGDLPQDGLVTCYSSYAGEPMGGISVVMPQDAIDGYSSHSSSTSDILTYMPGTLSENYSAHTPFIVLK